MQTTAEKPEQPIVVRSYRDLKVWNKAVDLVVACYRLTVKFPKHETYGLASQIQRSAASVPANIAEGHGRHSLGDYLHHLSIARGSLMETETHIIVAQRLAYITEAELDSALARSEEVSRMLAGLAEALRRSGKRRV